MSERRQVNIRLGDTDFDRKVAEIRRQLVLNDATRIPSLADILRTAVDRMHDDVCGKGRKRA